MKKKFIHIWQAAYPWEVRVGKINRTLQANGYEPIVLARRQHNEPKNEKLKGGEQVYRVGFASKLLRILSIPLPFNFLWYFKLSKIIKLEKPEFIIVRDIPLAWLASVAAKKYSLKVILDMAEHYPEAMRSWKKYSTNFILKYLVHDLRLPDFIEKIALRKMAAVWVVCDEQKERLVHEYGYNQQNITVLLNTPEVIYETSNFEKPNSRISFGYTGILCKDRDLGLILEGFALFCQDHQGASLVIAGDGEVMDELKQQAQLLFCRNQIKFLGRYNTQQLPQIYEQFNFGIVALEKNIFTEHTVANKFFDYANLAKPFIFTALKPLNNIMQSMQCGVAFNAGDKYSVCEAMKKIVNANYSKLAQAGHKSIEQNFNWKVDSAKLIQSLKNMNIL